MQFISKARHIVLQRLYSRSHCNAKTFHNMPAACYHSYNLALYLSWKSNISIKESLDIKIHFCAEQKYGYSMKYVLHGSTMRLHEKNRAVHCWKSQIFYIFLLNGQKCRPFIPLCDQSGIHAVQDNILRAIPLQQLRPLCGHNNKYAFSWTNVLTWG